MANGLLQPGLLLSICLLSAFAAVLEKAGC